MDHQQFINALQQSHDHQPTAVFVDGPDGKCRFQILFVDNDQALLEVLVGPNGRHSWSLKQLMSPDAIDRLEEFGYQRLNGYRVLQRIACGNLSLVASGAWLQVEVLFKYIFRSSITDLSISTQPMNWDWNES